MLVAVLLATVCVAPPAQAVTERTFMISTSPGGVRANAATQESSVSDAGNFVAFTSAATNLVPSKTVSTSDVFLKHVSTGEVSWISERPGGGQASGASSAPSISADGKRIAFQSQASDLASCDANLASDVFVYDVPTHVLSLVSAASGCAANGTSTQPAISSDGHWVAFTSAATNLIAQGDNNGYTDVYAACLPDVTFTCPEKPVVLISATVGGGLKEGDSSQPSISASGRFVAFSSKARILSDDRNDFSDVYVRNRAVKEGALDQPGNVALTQASVGPEIVGAVQSFLQPNAASSDPVVAADDAGAATPIVAFTSVASNLAFRGDPPYFPPLPQPAMDALQEELKQDVNTVEDVYLRNLAQGVTQLLSIGTDGETDPDQRSWDPSISADGSSVAFASLAKGLLLDPIAPGVGESDGPGADVFVRSLAGQFTVIADKNSNDESASGLADTPSISRDGQFVTFRSQGSNLDAGHPLNGVSYEVYMRDLLRCQNDQTEDGTISGPIRNGVDAPTPVRTVHVGAEYGPAGGAVQQTNCTYVVPRDP